jgi:hypothetical protein
MGQGPEIEEVFAAGVGGAAPLSAALAAQSAEQVACHPAARGGLAAEAVATAGVLEVVGKDGGNGQADIGMTAKVFHEGFGGPGEGGDRGQGLAAVGVVIALAEGAVQADIGAGPGQSPQVLGAAAAAVVLPDLAGQQQEEVTNGAVLVKEVGAPLPGLEAAEFDEFLAQLRFEGAQQQGLVEQTTGGRGQGRFVEGDHCRA